VAHPSQAKAKEFVAVDQRSGIEAIRAAKCASVAHFIYLSVGHPAPAMHAYIAVRSVCEAELEASGLNATILRPWYVLGPGHRWPYALIPFCWLAEGPSTIAKARGGWGCGRGRRRRSIRQPASASLKVPAIRAAYIDGKFLLRRAANNINAERPVNASPAEPGSGTRLI